MATTRSANVLVCFGEHKRPVTFTCLSDPKADRKRLEEAVINKFHDVMVETRSSRSGLSLLLQIKSEGWGGEFIDLPEDAELPDGSVLRAIILEPQGKNLPGQGSAICKKLSAPSNSERRELSNLFPSSRATGSYKRVFDPTAECLALPQQKKKKAAGLVLRPTSREVVLMKAFRSVVPIKKFRSELKSERRIQSLQFKRTMSPEEVKQVIIRGFHHIQGFSSFQYLENSSNNLSIASNQEYDGVTVIERRGALYLCEVKVAAEIHTTEKSADLVISSEIPCCSSNINDSPDTDSDLPAISVTSQESLVQRRELIRQQDCEYNESLRMDQRKNQDDADMRRRKESLNSLRARLIAKRVGVSGTKVITFRLPSSERLEEAFNPEDTTKALYEYIFCTSSVAGPFGILSLFPRKLLPTFGSHKIADVEGVLVVEEDDSFPDPLTYLEMGVADTDVTSMAVLKGAEDERCSFMEAQPTSTCALPHVVPRDNVFQSVLTLYKNNMENIINEYPFRAQFQGERAVDLGGVSREMFTILFEEAYQKLFDGCTLLTPAVHPRVDMSSFLVFGAIVSHAYLVTGVLPVRVAFPTLAHCLIGSNIRIPDEVMLKSFMDSLSTHDAAVLKTAFEEHSSEFTPQTRAGLISIFSRSGFREIPTPQALKSSVLRIAACEFVLKPSAAILEMNSGIPSQHRPFWEKVGIEGLLNLYKAKSVSAAKVLEMFDEAEGSDLDQERVLTYLRQYIGSMSNEDLSTFLRFVTGSSVCMPKKIQVLFNTITGIARRPICHTCEPSLELSSTYSSFVEFVREFHSCMTNTLAWQMDAL